MGDKRAWTARGEITEADKLVIRSVAEQDKAAGRIFVSGEASESSIGDAGVTLLSNVNDTLYENGAGQEPLFIQTRGNTVRMNRFDPASVWRCINPVYLEELIELESKRLGFDWIPLEAADFYESLALHIRAEHGDSFPAVGQNADMTTLYQAVYLGSLILYNKPNYMAVSAAEHFAKEETEAFMHGVMYQKLNSAQVKKLNELRVHYQGIRGLTNPELHFLVDLYQEMKQK